MRTDPGRSGRLVDRAELARRLLAAAAAGEAVVGLPLRPVAPQPDATALAALGVRRLLTSFRSDFDPQVPRAENVTLATAALDGLLMAPGEVLSVMAIVGPVDAAHGFRTAWVIAGGRLVPGVGGGVCQVASTLYGDAPAGRRIEVQSERLATYQPPTVYVDDPALAPGQAELWSEGEAGYRSVAWRLVYQGDRLVSREQLSLDSYPATPRLVGRGSQGGK